MKPYKSFLFLLVLAIVAGNVLYFYPGASIPVYKSFSIRIPTLFDEQKKDVGVQPTLAYNEKMQPNTLRYDWTQEELADNIQIDTSFLCSNQLKNIPAYPIEYTGQNPLIKFYEKLQDSNRSKPLRIAHFGDSQIEGDHISSTLRDYFQRSFGGSGCGFLPLFSPVNANSFEVNYSPEWTKKTVLNTSRQNNFGLTMGYISASETDEQPFVEIRKFPYVAYPTSTRFENLHLLVSLNTAVDDIQVVVRQQTMDAEFQIDTLGGFQWLSMRVPAAFANLKILFPSQKRSLLYGVFLDSCEGIAVDNYSLRGAAGYIFSCNTSNVLKESFTLTNTSLIIFQFGVNAVPAASVHLKSTQPYEDNWYKELSYMRTLAPDVPILVIGTSDRSSKTPEGFETNPNIKCILTAQRNAALRAGCAFWSLFDAMGGENSMQEWMNQKPRLCAKDFVHFSQHGAKQVGEMMYKSIASDYWAYLYEKQADSLRRTPPPKELEME